MKEILERLVCQDIKQMSYEERERSKSVHSSGEEESGKLGHALRDIEHAKTENEQINALKQWRDVILRIRGDLEEEFAVILKYQEAKQQKEQERTAKMQTIVHDSFGQTRTQNRFFTEKKKKSVNFV